MFKIDRAKLMKGPWPGRVIEAVALVGLSTLVGIQTAEDYTPGMNPKAKDLNKDTAQAEHKADVAPPVAPPSAKAADLAKKIEEERKGLAAKKADQDVRREHAGARLDGVLAAHEKAERPGMFDRITGFFSKEPSSAERKAALQNDIAARAQAYMDPKSQASISATGPRKQEGSFWGGALTTAAALVSMSLLVKKLSGKRPGRWLHGPVHGVKEHNEALKARLDKGMGEKIDKGTVVKGPDGADITRAYTRDEEIALRGQYAEKYDDSKVDVGHVWFSSSSKVFDSHGNPLPHATRKGRGEAVTSFNDHAAQPASAPHAPATAPSASQPAAATAHPEPTPTAAASGVNYDVPAVRRRAAAVPPASPPAASAEVVDTSGLATGFEASDVVRRPGKPNVRPAPKPPSGA